VTSLSLLRHGETVGAGRLCGQTDEALTEQGWRQMQQAVGEGIAWDRIVSSPLCRCADFARALARRTHLPLTLEPRLREIHFGVWEGRAIDELMVQEGAALARFWSDPDRHPPPRAESLADFCARVDAVWDELVRSAAGQHVLVVTHSGVIRAVFAGLLGRARSRLLEFDVPYAGLYRIDVTKAGTVQPRSVPQQWQP
jgi:broad specificity phosphatase PhoE